MKAKAVSHQEIKLQEKRPLPDGWRWTSLGEVCEFLDYRRIPINETDRAKRIIGKNGSELYPYYGANGQVGWINDYIFDEPLILLAEDGGNFGSKNKPIAYKVSGRYWVNNHAHVLKPLNDKINFDYCFYSVRIRPDVGDLVAGSTRAKLNQKVAAEIPIPLPPLPEQKRIVAILNERMAAVEQARATAEAQLEAARELPAAYLRAVFDGPEAQKWPKKKLRNISRLVSGSTPPRGNPENFIGTIPWVKTLDLNFGAVQKTEEFISESAFSQIRGELLPVGTVMIAMYGGKGTIGKSGILGLQATTNQAICSILPNSDFFVPEFLHYWLIFIRPEWMKYSGGNRKDPNINKKIVEEMKFPCPPVPLQKCIVADLIEKMNIAKSIRQSLEDQLDAINAIPAALLSQAFNGDL